MSKKYRVTINDGYEDFGLNIGDIVTKVENSIEDDLYELPEYLHGQGYTVEHLNLQEHNYIYIHIDDLEEIEEWENDR